MTQLTDSERTTYEDGAWHWVEKEGWIGDPPTIAPALYKAQSDAWYSFAFSGIPTREVKVLEPCRRASAEQDHLCQKAERSLMVRSLDEWVMETGAVTHNSSWHSELAAIVEMAFNKGAEVEAQLQAARRALVAPVPQGWKITEEMHVAAVKVLHRASGVDGLPQRMVDAMLAAAPHPPEPDKDLKAQRYATPAA